MDIRLTLITALERCCFDYTFVGLSFAPQNFNLCWTVWTIIGPTNQHPCTTFLHRSPVPPLCINPLRHRPASHFCITPLSQPSEPHLCIITLSHPVSPPEPHPSPLSCITPLCHHTSASLPVPPPCSTLLHHSPALPP